MCCYLTKKQWTNWPKTETPSTVSQSNLSTCLVALSQLSARWWELTYTLTTQEPRGPPFFILLSPTALFSSTYYSSFSLGSSPRIRERSFRKHMARTTHVAPTYHLSTQDAETGGSWVLRKSKAHCSHDLKMGVITTVVPHMELTFYGCM